jgi:hypothetical protein
MLVRTTSAGTTPAVSSTSSAAGSSAAGSSAATAIAPGSTGSISVRLSWIKNIEFGGE